jgi:hypothetical protein
MRLARLERIPPDDLHHDSGVQLFLDEKSLREPASEIVTADVLEVRIASLLSSVFSSALHDSANAALGEIDEQVPRWDVLTILELLEVALDPSWEKGISRLPTVAASILPMWNAKAVLSRFLLDAARLDLWDLERAQADVRAQLDDDVVSLARGGTAEILDLVVGHPDLGFVVTLRRFKSHVDYYAKLRIVSIGG